MKKNVSVRVRPGSDAQRHAASAISVRSELLAGYVTTILDAVLAGDAEGAAKAYEDLKRHLRPDGSCACGVVHASAAEASQCSAWGMNR